MKLRLALAALVASGLTAPSFAAEPLPKADPAKGKTIASQVCVACHGPDGNGTAPVNPKLAEQIPEYLYKQLSNFKPSGGKKPERDNAIMAGMVANLSPEDMRNLAAFYSGQKLVLAKANLAGIDVGEQIYRAGIRDKGVPACASCHGATGAGIPQQYPRVGGQFAEYTEAQMKAWRSGERANDPNKMMRMTAARLTDAEIKAVSNYIAGLH